MTARQVCLTACLSLGLLALPGCASRGNPADPMEGWNRKVFAFNESADTYLVKPVAEGYRAVVPGPVDTAFTNVAGNFQDMWSTINLFLQGRLRDGTLGIIRVTINTTFGLLGTIDMASAMQIDKPNEDFGQTLGVWGVGSGPYIVWPFLGPSTLRDTADLPGAWTFSVSALGTYPRESNLLTVADKVRLRASLLDAGNLMSDVALDKYAFMRDAYLQRRRNLIYNGDPPDDDADDDQPPYEPDPVEAPAAPGAASAPAVPSAPAPASAPGSAVAPAAPASSASAPASPAGS